jgi:hypothetical protein
MKLSKQQISSIQQEYQRQTGQPISVGVVANYIEGLREVGNTPLSAPAVLKSIFNAFPADSQAEKVAKPESVDPVYLERYTESYLNPDIYGCTDTEAFNYNPNATINKGCIPKIVGCMEEGSFNYNPKANTPGVCIPKIYGCTDPKAANYSPTANVNQGCITKKEGCTDPKAVNYDATAHSKPSTCQYQSADWQLGWNFIALSPYEMDGKVYDYWKSVSAFKTNGVVDPAKVLKYGIKSYRSQQSTPRIYRPQLELIGRIAHQYQGYNFINQSYDKVPEGWSYLTVLLVNQQQVDKLRNSVPPFGWNTSIFTQVSSPLKEGCMDIKAKNYDPTASIPIQAECHYSSSKWEEGWNFVAIGPTKFPDGEVYDYWASNPATSKDGRTDVNKIIEYGERGGYRSQQTLNHLNHELAFDLTQATEMVQGWNPRTSQYENLLVNGKTKFQKKNYVGYDRVSKQPKGEYGTAWKYTNTTFNPDLERMPYITSLILNKTAFDRYQKYTGSDRSIRDFGWDSQTLLTPYVIPVFGCMDPDALNYNSRANTPMTCEYSNHQWAEGWNFVALPPFITKKGDLVDVYTQMSPKGYGEQWSTDGLPDPKKIQLYGTANYGYASQQTHQRISTDLAMQLVDGSTALYGWNMRTFSYTPINDADNWSYISVLLLGKQVEEFAKKFTTGWGWNSSLLSNTFQYKDYIKFISDPSRSSRDTFPRVTGMSIGYRRPRFKMTVFFPEGLAEIPPDQALTIKLVDLYNNSQSVPLAASRTRDFKTGRQDFKGTEMDYVQGFWFPQNELSPSAYGVTYTAQDGKGHQSSQYRRFEVLGPR